MQHCMINQYVDKNFFFTLIFVFFSLFFLFNPVFLLNSSSEMVLSLQPEW